MSQMVELLESFPLSDGYTDPGLKVYDYLKHVSFHKQKKSSSDIG